MASRSGNLLLPIGVGLTVILIAGAVWFINKETPRNYGNVGPEFSSDPVPQEIEADSVSDSIDSFRGQLEIVEQTVEQRVNETLAASEALQQSVAELSEERALEQQTLRERTEAQLEAQRERNAELGRQIEELTQALLARIDSVESRITDQELIDLQIPIEGGQEEAPRFRSGQRIAATELNDIVWLASLDDTAALMTTTNDSEGLATAVSDGVSRLRTGGALLAEPGAASGDNATGTGLTGRVNPNVRSELIREHREQVRTARNQAREDIVETAPETEPVYTLPDLSIGFDSSALTALVGRVYLNENRVENPFEFKLVLGRDNVAANAQALPDEIEGMFFEGYATGDRLLSCVRGVLTAASFLFTDGTVVPAYIGDEGSRPANDAYPSNRIGYITDPRGNCVPGQFISDAPKWLAANALLAGAQGYAQALRQQEIETASIIDGTNVTVVENFTGEAGRFAGASALVGGFDVVNEYARERLGEVFEAVYVPPGHPVVVHLQQELRLDRQPDARKINYPRSTGQNNAFLD